VTGGSSASDLSELLGFAGRCCSFCEQTNAGKAFRAIREDPLPAQNHGRRAEIDR
jgi:hypothetical protein